MKWYKTQIRHFFKVFLITLSLLWLLQPTAVSAGWSHEFTDATGWEFTAFAMYEDGSAFVEGTPTWQITDGQLVSDRPVDDFTDFACHANNFSDGTWEIDITGYGGGFYLTNGWDPQGHNIQTHPFTGIMVNIDIDAIRLTILYEKDGFFDISRSTIKTTVSGSHRYALSANDTFVALSMDNEFIASRRISLDSRTIIPVKTLQEVCLVAYGHDEPISFDNLVGTDGEFKVEFPPPTPPTSTTPLPNITDQHPKEFKLFQLLPEIGLGILATAVVIYFSVRYVRKRRFQRKYHINGNLPVKKSVSRLFNNKSSLYYALVGLKSGHSRKTIKEIASTAPPELFTFKFLLQPIRLSIIERLYSDYKMASTQLRTDLGLTWVQFTNHTKSLEEREFIEIQTEMTPDGVQQFVYLLPLGKERFERLTELLAEFLSRSQVHNDKIKQFSFDNLYPDN